MGSWVTYSLGSDSENLPALVVMIPPGGGGGGQPLYDRLWGAGFLPSRYQAVKFRSVGDPVLFLKDPAGFTRDNRRAWLDTLGRLNQFRQVESGDPESATRIAQYEMAFQMQSSVPELTDVSKEPAHTFELYGEEAGPQAPSPPIAFLPGDWLSGAFVSFTSTIAIGITIAACPKDSLAVRKKPIARRPA
jgi:hypothetical protein